MNNVGLEVVFWTVLSVYLLARLGVFKKNDGSVVESVDTPDLKSVDHYGRGFKSPTPIAD